MFSSTEDGECRTPLTPLEENQCFLGIPVGSLPLLRSYSTTTPEMIPAAKFKAGIFSC
jgi:hypothetical protein